VVLESGPELHPWRQALRPSLGSSEKCRQNQAQFSAKHGQYSAGIGCNDQ